MKYLKITLPDSVYYFLKAFASIYEKPVSTIVSSWLTQYLEKNYKELLALQRLYDSFTSSAWEWSTEEADEGSEEEKSQEPSQEPSDVLQISVDTSEDELS